MPVFDTGNADTVAGQLSRYLAIVGQEADTSVTALAYWSRYQNTYTKLAPIAQGLLSAPASQAYVERIFSLCGLLTAGRRNRMKQSLEMHVFLKLNSTL